MIEVKSVEKPDERRDFPRGHIEITRLTGLTFAVFTLEPGWRWTESVAPVAGTDTCQVRHTVYTVRGRIRVRMEDGTESEIGAGDIAVIPPGHDAWVVGDEPYIAYDFSSEMENYAQGAR